jgi:hypothetical protein
MFHFSADLTITRPLIEVEQPVMCHVWITL